MDISQIVTIALCILMSVPLLAVLTALAVEWIKRRNAQSPDNLARQSPDGAEGV